MLLEVDEKAKHEMKLNSLQFVGKLRRKRMPMMQRRQRRPLITGSGFQDPPKDGIARKDKNQKMAWS
jgi:hypothetical protein